MEGNVKQVLKDLQVSSDRVLLNNKFVQNVRAAMSVILGVFAGILGLEGVWGFLLYFVASIPVSLGLYLKTRGKPYSYFTSLSDILYNGVFGNLLSFVLFWT
jgi:hypothetical protein